MSSTTSGRDTQNNTFAAITGWTLYSTFLFVALYLAIVWVWAPASIICVKLVKLVSLVQINLHAGDFVIESVRERIRPCLNSWYRFVRTYTWFAAIVVMLSILPDAQIKFIQNVVVDPIPWEWARPNMHYFVHDPYLSNAAIFLYVILYFVGNLCGVLTMGGDEPAARHLWGIIYFVDIPIITAFVAFFIVVYVMHWESDGAREYREYFVDGAVALLIFLSNSITTCVDRYAERTFYRSVRERCISGLIGALAVRYLGPDARISRIFLGSA